MTRDREDPGSVEVVDRKSGVPTRDEEPPVVARLVVEIRSDGSRTIARGALEDKTLGQKVAIEARGDNPFSLALGLAKAIFSAPSLARTAARALLPSRKKR